MVHASNTNLFYLLLTVTNLCTNAHLSKFLHTRTAGARRSGDTPRALYFTIKSRYITKDIETSKWATCSACRELVRFDSFRYCWISRITLGTDNRTLLQVRKVTLMYKMKSYCASTHSADSISMDISLSLAVQLYRYWYRSSRRGLRGRADCLYTVVFGLPATTTPVLCLYRYPLIQTKSLFSNEVGKVWSYFYYHQ